MKRYTVKTSDKIMVFYDKNATINYINSITKKDSDYSINLSREDLDLSNLYKELLDTIPRLVNPNKNLLELDDDDISKRILALYSTIESLKKEIANKIESKTEDKSESNSKSKMDLGKHPSSGTTKDNSNNCVKCNKSTPRQRDAVKFCCQILKLEFEGNIDNFNDCSNFLKEYLEEAKQFYTELKCDFETDKEY